MKKASVDNLCQAGGEQCIAKPCPKSLSGLVG